MSRYAPPADAPTSRPAAVARRVAIEPAARSEPELAERVRFGLWFVLGCTAFFAVADAVFDRQNLVPLYALKAVLAAVVAVAFVALRRDRSERAAQNVALLVIATSFSVSAVAAGIGGDGFTTSLLCSAVSVTTAAFLPWSLAAQTATVALGILAVLGNALLVHGSVAGAVAYPSIVVVASFGLSIYLAHLRGVYRAAASRVVEALESADRFKTDFLANMSHELRTPLNVIIGYNDLLLDGAYGALAAEQRAAIERTQHNARELLGLVSTVLQLSRDEARAVALDLATVSTGELVEELSREAGALKPKSGVALEWTVAPDAPRLESDPLKLRMVLKNLVDNALKFTERGTVCVRVAQRDGGAEFEVADTGVGIAAADLDRIFEPFRQLPGADHSDGVGLGLYLVKRLVDALGGRITVDSAVAVGTTFRVWVPPRPDLGPFCARAAGLVTAGPDRRGGSPRR